MEWKLAQRKGEGGGVRRARLNMWLYLNEGSGSKNIGADILTEKLGNEFWRSGGNCMRRSGGNSTKRVKLILSIKFGILSGYMKVSYDNGENDGMMVERRLKWGPVIKAGEENIKKHCILIEREMSKLFMLFKFERRSEIYSSVVSSFWISVA